jgi:hypothetical protein
LSETRDCSGRCGPGTDLYVTLTHLILLTLS